MYLLLCLEINKKQFTEQIHKYKYYVLWKSELKCLLKVDNMRYNNLYQNWVSRSDSCVGNRDRQHLRQQGPNIKQIIARRTEELTKK